MFGSLSFNEILFILVLALLIFGPKRLPEIGRTLGRTLGEFRRATSDLKRSMEVEMNLAEEREAAAGSPPPRLAAAGARPDPQRPDPQRPDPQRPAARSPESSGPESSGPESSGPESSGPASSGSDAVRRDRGEAPDVAPSDEELYGARRRAPADGPPDPVDGS